MYESEANIKVLNKSEIPSKILNKFSILKSTIISKSILPWSEHCTECAAPDCYSTCELYYPRFDKTCKLFVDGMIRIPNKDGIIPYIIKVTFKKWGKFWTKGNSKTYSLNSAAIIEILNIFIPAFIRHLPIPQKTKLSFNTIFYKIKKRISEIPCKTPIKATSFVIECYNPNTFEVSLFIIIKNNISNSNMFYQNSITIKPGYNLSRIQISSINKFVDLNDKFEIDIIPNNNDKELTLYFGIVDFIKELPTKKCKCVVWDLDNTLWDGVLIENSGKIKLKNNIIEIIKKLDQRGILNSIASKNNTEETIKFLKDLDILEYFLYPQISWEPKSNSIKNIANSINIGLDTIVFIDDQKFEREEVKNILSEVTTLDASDYQNLLNMEIFNVPITDDSKLRRRMYQHEKSRKQDFKQSGSDYRNFLRNCQITISLSQLNKNNLKRVYELAQRTNQLNFTGNRYHIDELDKIMNDPIRDTYVISCNDKYGSYGIIGFAVVNNQKNRLLDLMFSCRVQSKHIEHAFLTHIIHSYSVKNIKRPFYADYKKTDRNTPGGKVFSDLGFIVKNEINNVISLSFEDFNSLQDENIINIELEK